MRRRKDKIDDGGIGIGMRERWKVSGKGRGWRRTVTRLGLHGLRTVTVTLATLSIPTHLMSSFVRRLSVAAFVEEKL